MRKSAEKLSGKQVYLAPQLARYGKLESITGTGLGSGPDLLGGQKRPGDLV